MQPDLTDILAAPAAAPHLERAVCWADAYAADLTARAGPLSPEATALVETAARQLAVSLFLFESGDRQDDAATLAASSEHADAFTRSVLAAHELCADQAGDGHLDSVNAHGWVCLRVVQIAEPGPALRRHLARRSVRQAGAL